MDLIKSKNCHILEKGISEFDCYDNFPHYVESLGIFLKNVEEMIHGAGYIAELKKPVPIEVLTKYKIMQAEDHFPKFKGKILIGYTVASRAIIKKIE